jgi:phosphate transport system protein
MRESFHGELTLLGERLAHMCALAAESMTLAERVLTADAELDHARAECEEQAQSLLALQSPVAGDLRTILAAVYCAEKIERMGDLAAHIADTARFTHPEHAVPDELEAAFTEMGAVAAGMADRIGELLSSEAAGGFAELDETDHIVDTLHAQVLTLITGGDWQHGVRSATSLALLARFYERFADQAVSVSKRLEFAETGAAPSAG